MKSHRKYILIFSLRGNSLVALEDIRVIAFLNITAEETEEAFLERVEFLRESFKVISSEFFFWMTFYCDFDAFYCEFDAFYCEFDGHFDAFYDFDAFYCDFDFLMILVVFYKNFVQGLKVEVQSSCFDETINTKNVASKTRDNIFHHVKASV
eukprot:GHVP01029948.1.p1 GENE.GHVP01029948.1~~GHVP01029948.1.p1  ORF type:complete len:152 (-),score=29.99 GHVP01029948.1:113-568(-)